MLLSYGSVSQEFHGQLSRLLMWLCDPRSKLLLAVIAEMCKGDFDIQERMLLSDGAVSVKLSRHSTDGFPDRLLIV